MIATEVLGPVGNPKYKEYAWDIVNSGRRLLAMVESVLEFSENGDRAPLKLEPFDLRELISEFFEHEGADTVVSTGRESDEREGIRTGRLMLRADRGAVQTMMMNLVSNALKHNPPNSSVRVTARQLPDRSLVLSVIDDGIGIEREVIDRLGDLFNLDNDPYLTGPGGLGLGLVATKRLIERHGGSLEIESERGKGSTVRLVFPSDSLIPDEPPAGASLN
jgi:two-component system cell cycle sensor histidine kinase PleC